MLTFKTPSTNFPRFRTSSLDCTWCTTPSTLLRTLVMKLNASDVAFVKNGISGYFKSLISFLTFSLGRRFRKNASMMEFFGYFKVEFSFDSADDWSPNAGKLKGNAFPMAKTDANIKKLLWFMLTRLEFSLPTDHRECYWKNRINNPSLWTPQHSETLIFEKLVRSAFWLVHKVVSS